MSFVLCRGFEGHSSIVQCMCVFLCVMVQKTNMHTHCRLCEEALYFCDMCTVCENIDGPQGGV